MNVLMITRKIDRDDWLAGHSYEWAKKLVANLSATDGQLFVLCLQKGNIEGLGAEVVSLGKEAGASRFRRFWRFQKQALRLYRRVDAVFCHQNPEYTIAIWPYCFIFRKRLVSWYAHKAVTWKTRLMVWCSSAVLTPSIESLRLPSPKIRIVGHGIDTARFKKSTDAVGVVSEGAAYTIVTVGRISTVKKISDLVTAMDILVRERKLANMHATIIGSPALPADIEYAEYLKRKIHSKEMDQAVRILPAVSHQEIPRIYQRADLFVSLSQTGSLDKAVLEAMACECPIITSNESFTSLLQPFADLCLVKPHEPAELASKIEAMMKLNLSDRRALGANLRQLVVEKHDLTQLVEQISKSLSG